MEIVVCVKRVPNTGQTGVNPQTGKLQAVGAQYILNPYDEYALEQALRVKDKVGGRVTVISVGPAEAEGTLRDAIAVGADAGILVCDPAFEYVDTYHTALLLAKAIQKMGKAQLVICGNKAIDSDTWQVAPQLAALLGWPQILFVKKVTEISEQKINADRMTEEGFDRMEGSFPMLISVLKEIGECRLPSLKGKMNAKKAPVEKWDKAALGISDADLTPKSFIHLPQFSLFKKQNSGKVFTGESKEIVESFVKAIREDKIL